MYFNNIQIDDDLPWIMNTQVEAAIFIDEKSSDKTFGQFSIKFL
jgi:hypothetical protein